MKDDKITEVNFIFSENLRITSASNFHDKLFYYKLTSVQKACPSSHPQRKNELLYCHDGHTYALLCFTILPSASAAFSFPAALRVFYYVKWTLIRVHLWPDFLNKSVNQVRPGGLSFLQRRTCTVNSPPIPSRRLASPSSMKPLDPQVFHLLHKFIGLCTKYCFSVQLKENISSDCKKVFIYWSNEGHI